MIRFNCPTCKSALESPERKDGSAIACPKCATRIIVPAPAESTFRVQTPLPPATPPMANALNAARPIASGEANMKHKSVEEAQRQNRLLTVIAILVGVLLLRVVVVVCLMLFLLKQSDQKDSPGGPGTSLMADTAKFQTKKLAKDCETYKSRFGQYPQSLEQLFNPPDGNPILDDPRSIYDPWGQKYKIEIEQGLVISTVEPGSKLRISSAD